MQTIGLNMIVKDESKVIKRLLDSVAPIVDWYTIVDTGSSDDTIHVIKKVMDIHGIEGEVISHEWVNYADARNRAIKELKGKVDWGFWIDADEEVILDNLNKEALLETLSKCNTLGVEVQYSGTVYNRDQFFKVSEDWEWVGAVHEYLHLDPTKIKHGGIAEGFHVKVNTDGATWNTALRDKYMGHADMLLKYIEENKDPRWVFYLANSYRDAGVMAQARRWYKERLSMEGYWEEKYISQLRLAEIAKATNQNNWIEEYLKCSEIDKRRAEHYLPVIRHFNTEGNYNVAYALGKYAWDNCSNNPFPYSRLFISNSVYNWELLDAFTISCFYLDRKEELNELITEMDTRIEKKLVPFKEIERITNNKKYYNGL